RVCRAHLSLLFSLPRPLTSPLFPYTTLFRSRAAHDLFRGLEHEQEASAEVPDVIDQRARGAEHHRDVGVVAAGVHVAVGLRLELDRKSTRLNSSHVSISYAVFCLKKKKNKRDITLFVIDIKITLKHMLRCLLVLLFKHVNHLSMLHSTTCINRLDICVCISIFTEL